MAPRAQGVGGTGLCSLNCILSWSALRELLGFAPAISLAYIQVALLGRLPPATWQGELIPPYPVASSSWPQTHVGYDPRLAGLAVPAQIRTGLLFFYWRALICPERIFSKMPYVIQFEFTKDKDQVCAGRGRKNS